MLKRYDWPGNIRELQNLMERAVIGTSGSELRLPDDEFGRVEFDTPSKWRTLAEVERQHILDTLRQVGWVVGGPSGAAVRLGLPRTTLLHRMHRLGIARGAAQADRLPKAHPKAAAKAAKVKILHQGRPDVERIVPVYDPQDSQDPADSEEPSEPQAEPDAGIASPQESPPPFTSRRLN